MQVWSFHISAHVRPLTRHVQSGSLQTREHLQASSSSTTSGADVERIQRMFSLLSSSVQPCWLGLGTLGLASKQRLQIAAWKLALCACRKRQSLHGVVAGSPTHVQIPPFVFQLVCVCACIVACTNACRAVCAYRRLAAETPPVV